MGERKVINKYFPPDFDPTKIPRQDKAKREKIVEKFVVRMMLPMSVRCQTCGEYMYKGKKFNSRKESVAGPDGEYLGIQIFRFYFKCITCSAEFTIKTDPQNMDYVVEGGAKANYELYKEEKKEKDAIASEKAEGEQYDAMKKLENKTEESKRAMDILDALDEIRTNNARAASVGIEDILEARNSKLAAQEQAIQSQAEREDELEAQRAFAAARTKRIREDDEEDDGEGGFGRGGGGGFGCGSGGSGTSASTHPPRGGAAGAGSSSGMGGAGKGSSTLAGGGGGAASMPAAKQVAKKPKLPMGVIIQPKAPVAPKPPPATAPAPPSAPAAGPGGAGGLLGLGAYDSSGSGSGSGSGNED